MASHRRKQEQQGGGGANPGNESGNSENTMGSNPEQMMGIDNLP
jgi:hypothetical protein